jgi:alpha-glucosidase
MTEWWRGGVIYQVYPRSFQDTNGDGVGDLPGIIRRLDHIQSLGVDCIWLSPITRSPQADMGYDVSDYRDVDPLFGLLHDFDSLVEQAHHRGLKVIMDQVVSHTSDLHPWFQESRLNRTNAKADWYIWANPLPDGSPPNNWPAVFGGRAWEWNPTRGQYYMHNFLASQPDLNFHNPDVQQAVLDVMRFWLERGIDGFRLDTVNYYFHDKKLRSNPPNKLPEHLAYAVNPYDMQEHKYSKSQPENLPFLRRVRSLLNEYPGTTSVGEVGDSHRSVELMAEYTSGGDTLHMCYGFDFLGHEFTAEHFRSRIEKFFRVGPDGWPCWSFSNHDVPRHMTRWAPHSQQAPALARQAAALVLSLKGSVCLYQGEELGLPETELLFEELTDPRGIRFWPEDKGRDGCRTPMPWDAGDAPNGFTTGKPWLPVKPTQSALNVSSQNADPDSTLAFYRQILAWRKEHPVLATGDITFIDNPEPILAYHRTLGNEAMLCVFNLSAEPQSFPLQNAATGVLQPVSHGAGLAAQAIDLAPNGYAFLIA